MFYQSVLFIVTLAVCLCFQSSRAEETASLFALERDLKLSESRFNDLVDSTEKHVRWYNNEKRSTPVSIVYLHGFSATRMELHPLIDQLADRLQANVFYTRLTGHGRSEDAMLDGSVSAWKKDALEAWSIGQKIGQKVIVIGTSTGATLASWLSAQPVAQNLHAAIMISPNFGVKSRRAGMVQWSLGLWLAKKLNGEYYSFTPQNDFHARFWTERYPLEAVVPMLDLVDEVAALDKSTITTPHLIVYSPNDVVVDVEKIKATVRKLDSANVKAVPFTISKDPAQHVLVGEASSPGEVGAMLDIIQGFMRELD